MVYPMCYQLALSYASKRGSCLHISKVGYKSWIKIAVLFDKIIPYCYNNVLL